MTPAYRFRKNERLGSFVLRQNLFRSGQGFFEYPFRVVYLLQAGAQNGKPGETPDFGLKCLVSVPASKHKKATDRNLIRRRIKEAYRLNKGKLHQKLIREKKTCLIAWVYVASDILPFQEIEKKISVSLQEVLERLIEGSEEITPQ